MASKQRLNLLYLLLIIALLLVLCSAIRYGAQGFYLGWIENVRAKTLLYNGPVLTLTPRDELQQTFTANYPGLSRVDILVQGDGLDRQLIFRLKTDCNAPDDVVYLAVVLPGATGPGFYPFTFPPLDDSAGQSYCLVLQAPQASIGFPLSDGDLYPLGRLEFHRPETEPDTAISQPVAESARNLPYKIYLPLIQHQLQENFVEDLGFNLGYQGEIMPVAQIFLGRLTANKPYLWGQSWFYGGLVFLYIGLLVGLFLLVRQMIRV